MDNEQTSGFNTKYSSVNAFEIRYKIDTVRPKHTSLSLYISNGFYSFMMAIVSYIFSQTVLLWKMCKLWHIVKYVWIINFIYTISWVNSMLIIETLGNENIYQQLTKQ